MGPSYRSSADSAACWQTALSSLYVSAIVLPMLNFTTHALTGLFYPVGMQPTPLMNQRQRRKVISQHFYGRFHGVFIWQSADTCSTSQAGPGRLHLWFDR